MTDTIHTSMRATTTAITAGREALGAPAPIIPIRVMTSRLMAVRAVALPRRAHMTTIARSARAGLRRGNLQVLRATHAAFLKSRFLADITALACLAGLPGALPSHLVVMMRNIAVRRQTLLHRSAAVQTLAQTPMQAPMRITATMPAHTVAPLTVLARLPLPHALPIAITQ